MNVMVSPLSSLFMVMESSLLAHFRIFERLASFMPGGAGMSGAQQGAGVHRMAGQGPQEAAWQTAAWGWHYLPTPNVWQYLFSQLQCRALGALVAALPAVAARRRLLAPAAAGTPTAGPCSPMLTFRSQR